VCHPFAQHAKTAPTCVRVLAPVALRNGYLSPNLVICQPEMRIAMAWTWGVSLGAYGDHPGRSSQNGVIGSNLMRDIGQLDAGNHAAVKGRLAL
jgi:hypothetical protein